MYKSYIKKLLDIIISTILIIILSPLFLLISIAIKLDDKGKILYISKRTGLNGKSFKMYKFRTMNNKSVTRIGKILRTYSLDELPQLLNVIKGDMSLIGPRPWILDYYKRFNEEQKKRVNVKPGITGLAQVNGRNNIDIFKKIEYDLYYIDNISFLLDFKILFKSLKCIINHEDNNYSNNYLKKELKLLEKNNKKAF